MTAPCRIFARGSLDHPIHRDFALINRMLGCAAAVEQPGELQELGQLDRVGADFDFFPGEAFAVDFSVFMGGARGRRRRTASRKTALDKIHSSCAPARKCL